VSVVIVFDFLRRPRVAYGVQVGVVLVELLLGFAEVFAFELPLFQRI